jgi:hypothetical protein
MFETPPARFAQSRDISVGANVILSGLVKKNKRAKRYFIRKIFSPF